MCFSHKPRKLRPQANLCLLDRLHQRLRNAADSHGNKQRSTQMEELSTLVCESGFVGAAGEQIQIPSAFL